MRREVLLSVIVLLAVSCSKQTSRPDFTGTWVSDGQAEKSRFVVRRDGTCELTFKGGATRPSQINGDCKFDFSKRPIPLMIRNIPQLDHPVHTIVEFKNADEIRMGEFAPVWRLRPLTFDPKQTLVFKRMKETA